MATTLTSTTQPADVHADGYPIQRVATLSVGDLVTEGIGSDGYPGVVVGIAAKGKTVYVHRVRFVLGNVQANDQPGWNGYGDSATLVVDPESVEQALAAGIEGARKYVLRISHKPVGTRESGYWPSQRQQDEVGAPVFHLARWSQPGGYGSLSAGARYRQDPHV